MTAIIDADEAIRYVLDAKGNKTAVFIPIELWDTWKKEIRDTNLKSAFSLKKYRGILKGKDVNGRNEETKMRDEWD